MVSQGEVRVQKGGYKFFLCLDVCVNVKKQGSVAEGKRHQLLHRTEVPGTGQVLALLPHTREGPA